MHSIITKEIFSSHFRTSFQICVGGSYTQPNTAQESSSSSWHARLPPLSPPTLLRRPSPALPANYTVLCGCHRCPATVTKPWCDAPATILHRPRQVVSPPLHRLNIRHLQHRDTESPPTTNHAHLVVSHRHLATSTVGPTGHALNLLSKARDTRKPPLLNPEPYRPTTAPSTSVAARLASSTVRSRVLGLGIMSSYWISGGLYIMFLFFGRWIRFLETWCMTEWVNATLQVGAIESKLKLDGQSALIDE
jgi:hypothetical protein